MNHKRKELAFDIFYNRYRAAETYGYILKVVNSCVTCDQIHYAYLWGIEVLDNLRKKATDYVTRKYESISIWKLTDICFYIIHRVDSMQLDLRHQCNQRDHEIN